MELALNKLVENDVSIQVLAIIASRPDVREVYSGDFPVAYTIFGKRHVFSFNIYVVYADGRRAAIAARPRGKSSNPLGDLLYVRMAQECLKAANPRAVFADEFLAVTSFNTLLFASPSDKRSLVFAETNG